MAPLRLAGRLLTIICCFPHDILVAAMQRRAAPSWQRDDLSLCTEMLRREVDCSNSPWRPPITNVTSELCSDGKALPKLYVLGAQKTSTSSFAKDLTCAGVAPMPDKGGYNWKEMHFFDSRMSWDGIDDERHAWLDRLPACSEAKSMRLVADFTPDNLRMVPGEKPYNDVFVNMPETLRSFYGEARSNLTLVVMIREPLSRMHSAWYAARMCNYFGAICTDDCRADSIQDAMRTALRRATSDTPVFTEWLWTSMYARHLHTWLKHFDARQLYIIPYLEYAKGNADGICRDLSKRLDFPMRCESNGTEVSHEWKSEHPALDEDFPVGSEIKDAFNALMDAENAKLYDLLAEAHEQGMGLANYDGEIGSKEGIRKWLKERW